MSDLELIPLLQELSGGGVRFVVIGGVAVALHGPLRTTEDLDIVPAADAGNLLALGNVLASLDARLATDASVGFGPEHRNALAQGRSLTLATRLGDVDIIQRLAPVPYDELDAAAERFELGDATIAFACVEHLKAMKRARGSAQDLADIEALDALGAD